VTGACRPGREFDLTHWVLDSPGLPFPAAQASIVFINAEAAAARARCTELSTSLLVQLGKLGAGQADLRRCEPDCGACCSAHHMACMLSWEPVMLLCSFHLHLAMSAYTHAENIILRVTCPTGCVTWHSLKP
jgi:hypothetical protein